MRSAKLILTVLVLLVGAQLASAETLTLYPSADTCLYDGAVNNNWGAFTEFRTANGYGGGTLHYNGLISFDLDNSALTTPLEGFYTVIDSVTLTLTTAVATSSATTTVNIYELLKDFTEGTGTNTAALAGEPCWDWHQYNTVAWDAAGATGAADHGSTLMASKSVVNPTQGSKWTFTSTNDFTSLAQDNIGDTMNLFMCNTAVDAIFRFASKDYSGTTYDPKLDIGYYYEEIPEPATLALLGCGLIGLLAYAWRKRK